MNLQFYCIPWSGLDEGPIIERGVYISATDGPGGAIIMADHLSRDSPTCQPIRRDVYQWSVLHTENMAGGANWVFPRCRGREGKVLYDVLTLQKSRGARALNAALYNYAGQRTQPCIIMQDNAISPV